MVDGALERGLRPFVTLHHFTLPALVRPHAAVGCAPTPCDASSATSTRSRPVLDAGVTHVGTINEPNIVAMFATDTGRGMSALRARSTHCPIRRSPRRPDRRAPRGPRPTQGRESESRRGMGCFGAGLPGSSPGAEHLLADYTRPRDEVFLQASVGRRLGWRADLHPHPSRSQDPTVDPSRSRPRGPSHDERVGVLPRGSRRSATSRRARGRRRADHRHRERHRDRGRRANASSTPPGHCSRCAPPWTTASASTAICTGACSTTTNGAPTQPRSDSSPSTAPPSPAHHGHHSRGSGDKPQHVESEPRSISCNASPSPRSPNPPRPWNWYPPTNPHPARGRRSSGWKRPRSTRPTSSTLRDSTF